MNNILVIGVGPHAKRIYIPILMRELSSGLVNQIIGLDLREKEQDIETYKHNRGYTDFIKTFYIESSQVRYDKLAPEVSHLLDKLVSDYNINGVIIATEPMSHIVYCKWALSRGLSILMDKPLSTRRNVSTVWEEALGLLHDYSEIQSLYKNAQLTHPNIVFMLMAQRRYHPAFIKLKEFISEMTAETGCPVTSIQSFHSDGQWRLPTEIIDIDYHSYNQGHGKCSHSGYHFLDIVPWLLEAGETEDKKIDNVDVFANLVRPIDFITQIDFNDYARIFPGAEAINRYSYNEFAHTVRNYGEIDAFCSFAFKQGSKTLTLGSVNLVHNGFSQRGWASLEGRDLYKGNGRVRHENHIIEQGPFQAIYYQSYQSEEIQNETTSHYDVGGEYHLDIHVFRNSKLFPKWKSYDKLSIKDLDNSILQGYSRGHQEDARRYSTLEFLHSLNKPVNRAELVSELVDHRRGCVLMAGVYMSAIKRLAGENPLINLNFEKHPAYPYLLLNGHGIADDGAERNVILTDGHAARRKAS